MDNAFRFTTEDRGTWDPWLSEALPTWNQPPINGAVADPLILKGILPQEEFVERLRFERRLVDRSGAPLSLALFFMKEELLGDIKKLRELLASIKRDTRETDLKGWVNGSIFGLLLLHTDGSGAQKCAEHLVNGRTKTVCDVLTGTYPDRLFNEILEKNEAEPRIFPLELLGTSPDSSGRQIFKRRLDLKILVETVREMLRPKGGLQPLRVDRGIANPAFPRRWW